MLSASSPTYRLSERKGKTNHTRTDRPIRIEGNNLGHHSYDQIHYTLCPWLGLMPASEITFIIIQFESFSFLLCVYRLQVLH